MSIEADVNGAMALVRVNAGVHPPLNLPAIQVRSDPREPSNKAILVERRAIEAGLLELAKALDKKL